LLYGRQTTGDAVARPLSAPRRPLRPGAGVADAENWQDPATAITRRNGHCSGEQCPPCGKTMLGFSPQHRHSHRPARPWPLLLQP